MNFQSEKQKPIFIVRPGQISAANAFGTINEAVMANMAVHAESVAGDFLVKAAAAHRLPAGVLVRVADSTPAEVRDLVVQRLKASPSERFEFLDGTSFSGAEAASEVQRHTAMGQYFLDVEKETIRIVQQAYFEGKL